MEMTRFFAPWHAYSSEPSGLNSRPLTDSLAISVFVPSAALMRIDGRRLHIAEIQIAVLVGAERIGEAQVVGDQLPRFAGDQQVQQRQVAAEIAAGVEHRSVAFLCATATSWRREIWNRRSRRCGRILRPSRSECRSPCISEPTPSADWPTASCQRRCRRRRWCRPCRRESASVPSCEPAPDRRCRRADW